jgi:hypothetical protein
MRASLRFPILIGIGLAIGLLIGLALVHFLWLAVVIIVAVASTRWMRRRRV